MWISHKKYSEELHRAFNDGVSEQKRKENLCERQNEELRREIFLLQATIDNGKRESEKLSKVVREQSEADMMMSAIRVIVKVVQGEPKESINVETMYMKAAQVQQSAYSNPYGFGNMMGMGKLF